MANTIFSSGRALCSSWSPRLHFGFLLQRFKVFKTLVGPDGYRHGHQKRPTCGSCLLSPTYDAISGCLCAVVQIFHLPAEPGPETDAKLSRNRSLRWPRPYSASAWQLWCSAYCSPTKSTRAGSVAGMFVGFSTGGSSNLAAIAVGLDASKNTIASATPPTMWWASHADPDVCYPPCTRVPNG